MNNLLDENLVIEYKRAAQRYEKDYEYRKQLAVAIGMSEKDAYLLRPIVGEEEFKFILENLEEKNFMPGVRHDYTEMDSHDDIYLKAGDFRANLHIHSIHSDGLLKISDMLVQAAELGDKNFALKPTDMPLILAITDHDNIDSARETLVKVSQNPALYKNVRIVLGLEVSAITNRLKNLRKSLLVHTHMFCINPFDSSLYKYIEEKRELKRVLAVETIKKLNLSLARILDEYKIEFSLKEAAQLHPMLLMGQDEVCIPFKKYIGAKLLFSHYVLNNKKIMDLLEEKNIDIDSLRYERPIVGYKELYSRNLPYSVNYRDGLVLYLSKFVKNQDFSNYFDMDNGKVDEAIRKAFDICDSAHPTVDTMPEAFFCFEEALEELSKQEFGVFGIAHPARIIVKDAETTPDELFDELFSSFKLYGKEKALYYEGYYQSYFGTTYMDYLPSIEKAVSKFGFLKTGGMDTHGPKITTRHPFV